MGSVRTIHTTGDNDPEIEPVSCLRYYQYCDVCGSFDLKIWTEPEGDIDHGRGWRGRALRALLPVSSLVVVTSIWVLLGFVFSLPFVAVVLAGWIAAALVWGYGRQGRGVWWRIVGWVLLALPVLWLTDELARDVVSGWVLLGLGVLGILVALVADDGEPMPNRLGLRCAGCGATYPYESELFTDLEANPRGFTEEDIARPWGSSPYVDGAIVSNPTSHPPSRLPS